MPAEDLQVRLIVGLEIHVELATRTKMFTAAPNVACVDHHDAEPNTLLDPVVIGMPGVLPVVNRRAVEMSMLVGLALNCRIAARTKWDRKSYYYPDLPKNYQISQYDQPLCLDGTVDIPLTDDDGESAGTKSIRIIRAHLEEDAGKLLHEAPGGLAIDHSIVDLNRAGTPLLEIVTEPDFASAREVVTFAQMLRHICRHLGVTGGIMQQGHMRFEPNINVAINDPATGEEVFTPIVEIKNLNSFKALEGAVLYERRRQVDDWQSAGQCLESGSKSTRGWDDDRMVTVLQREKEEAHDYRYLPDPDLVPLHVDEAWVDEVRQRMGELPDRRRKRYGESHGLAAVDVETLIDEPALCHYFDRVVDTGVDPKRAMAMLMNYAAKHANARGCAVHDLGVLPEQVKGIVDLFVGDKLGSRGADELFGLCADTDEDAATLAESHGLLQVSDSSALEQYVDEVLADPSNAKAVTDIKGGKSRAIGALMGQIMKKSKGQANAKMVTEMIRKRLG